MPPKADPRDWDRLFRPGAPRRGGPLRALSNLILLTVVLGLLGGATFFALRFGLERARQQAADQVVAATTAAASVYSTRTARAINSTATTAALAANITPTAALGAEPAIGRGSVLNGGNLRNAPAVRDDTVIGQICPGDQVDFLEQSTGADGASWYRIRLTAAAASCSEQRVTIGSIGWASATLLSPPTP